MKMGWNSILYHRGVNTSAHNISHYRVINTSSHNISHYRDINTTVHNRLLQGEVILTTSLLVKAFGSFKWVFSTLHADIIFSLSSYLREGDRSGVRLTESCSRVRKK